MCFRRVVSARHYFFFAFFVFFAFAFFAFLAMLPSVVPFFNAGRSSTCMNSVHHIRKIDTERFEQGKRRSDHRALCIEKSLLRSVDVHSAFETTCAWAQHQPLSPKDFGGCSYQPLTTEWPQRIAFAQAVGRKSAELQSTANTRSLSWRAARPRLALSLRGPNSDAASERFSSLPQLFATPDFLLTDPETADHHPCS
jgi:hypothetical protein